MKHLIHAGFAIFAGLTVATTAAAQVKPMAGADAPKIYENLLRQIEQIPIYDNQSQMYLHDNAARPYGGNK